jgi:hypothetical protein
MVQDDSITMVGTFNKLMVMPPVGLMVFKLQTMSSFVVSASET